MREKILIAGSDMDAMQLMDDVLEINFRDVFIERALSPQAFWTKVPAVDDKNPWHLIFLSTEYIKEDPQNFLGRIRALNSGAPARVILMGNSADTDACDEEVRRLPLLTKPFSLDGFQEMIESVSG